eukprot:TRINITY_DN3818_c0_g1_i3.p1 TRINITY_DN3818_c0_g1~~TRINITY_DN3818_c0_g1_i3.p1  ORF type:complete len:452 (-),score=75.45 TRINITY_DN3818_c0_g1_i3:162-1517(-)
MSHSIEANEDTTHVNVDAAGPVPLMDEASATTARRSTRIRRPSALSAKSPIPVKRPKAEPAVKRAKTEPAGTRDASETSMSNAMPGFLDALPDEILVLIFAVVSVRDLGALSRVCRRLRRLADEDVLWQRLYEAVTNRQAKVKQNLSWKQHLRQATHLIRGKEVARHILSLKLRTLSRPCAPTNYAIGPDCSIALLFCHDDTMLVALYDPCGKLIAEVNVLERPDMFAPRRCSAIIPYRSTEFRALCFDCAGRVLLVHCSGQWAVRLSARGELLSAFTLDSQSSMIGAANVACAPDGRILTAGSRTISIYSPAGGFLDEIFLEHGPWSALAIGSNAMMCVVFQYDTPAARFGVRLQSLGTDDGRSFPITDEGRSFPIKDQVVRVRAAAIDATGRVACIVDVRRVVQGQMQHVGLLLLFSATHKHEVVREIGLPGWDGVNVRCGHIIIVIVL